MDPMLWYIAWVLLPLIPSVILFAALPKNQATIKKITKGFEIKLGGACALYFLVFYLINPKSNGWFYNEARDTQWRLVARFLDENKKPISCEQITDVEIVPRINFEEVEKNEALVVLNNVSQLNNTVKIPYTLRFVFKDYEAKKIPFEDSLLNEKFVRLDFKNNRLNLVNPLILSPKLQRPVVDTSEAAEEKPISN